MAQTKLKPQGLALSPLSQAMTGSNQAVTTTATDISGLAITLPKIGTYLITAIIEVEETAPGTGTPVVNTLLVNGVTQSPSISAFNNNVNISTFDISISGCWIVTTTAVNQVAKFQTIKAFNTGTYNILAGNTAMNAIQIG